MASRRNANTWGCLLGVFVTLYAAGARADERAVLKRLKSYGELSSTEAQELVDKISQRMRVAADITNADDPVRLAVSHALYDAAAPTDAAATSMVRLRLYAGLTEWALDQVFSSRRAVSKVCTESGVSAESCRSLLAAGQSVALAEISPLRLPARAAQAESAPVQEPQPVAAASPRAWTRPSTSRETSTSDAPQTVAPAAPARPARARSASLMVNKPSAEEVAQRKADYAEQRKAYLERRRQEMEARRAKIIATSGGGQRVQRGPATQEEAEVAGLAAGAKQEKEAPMVASSSTGAPKRATREKAADSDLFDSLLENPLGK